MDKLIAIEMKIGSVDRLKALNESLSENEIWFDPEECRLFGIRQEDFGRWVQVAVFNEKLPVVPEGKKVPVFEVDEAKEKYPFLFRK